MTEDDLQAEVELLRKQNQELLAKQTPVGARITSLARTVTVFLLILFGTISATLSVPTIWGRNLLLNTDRYVQTMTPVASDPGVQAAIATAIENKINSQINISDLLKQVLPPKAQILAGPLQSAATGLTDAVVTKFVQSKEFLIVWKTANTVAHTQIVYALTGKEPKNSLTTIAADGAVVLNLAPIIEQVKQQLVASGFTIAKNIPTVGATVTIAHLQGVDKTRSAVRWGNAAANWLPWIAIIFFAAAIAIAKQRRKTLMAAALAVAGGMVVLAVALNIGRGLYLGAVPSSDLPPDVAKRLFDTLLRFLHSTIRTVMFIALLVAFGTWLSGPTRHAKLIRRQVTSWALMLWALRSKWHGGGFLNEYLTAARVTVVVFGLLLIVFWSNPGVFVFLGVGIVIIGLLIALELLRDHPERDNEHTTPDGTSIGAPEENEIASSEVAGSAPKK